MVLIIFNFIKTGTSEDLDVVFTTNSTQQNAAYQMLLNMMWSQNIIEMLPMQQFTPSK